MKSVLRQNGYPTRFLDKITSKFLDKSLQKRIMVTTVLKKTLPLLLHSIGAQTLKLKIKNNKLFKDHSQSGKLVVIFRSTQRISSCFRLKDATPCSFLRGLIYGYKCPRCNSTQFNTQILGGKIGNPFIYGGFNGKTT